MVLMKTVFVYSISAMLFANKEKFPLLSVVFFFPFFPAVIVFFSSLPFSFSVVASYLTQSKACEKKPPGQSWVTWGSSLVLCLVEL